MYLSERRIGAGMVLYRPLVSEVGPKPGTLVAGREVESDTDSTSANSE